jgi:hypothetical protein
LDINTMELKRIFQGGPMGYEEIVAMLSSGGTKLLTPRESQVDAPNFYIRDSSKFNGNFAEPGSLDPWCCTGRRCRWWAIRVCEKVKKKPGKEPSALLKNYKSAADSD